MKKKKQEKSNQKINQPQVKNQKPSVDKPKQEYKLSDRAKLLSSVITGKSCLPYSRSFIAQYWVSRNRIPFDLRQKRSKNRYLSTLILVYEISEKHNMDHQTIITDDKKDEKYVKIRLKNTKIENIKVFKDNQLSKFDVVQKKKKGKGIRQTEKDETEEDKEVIQQQKVSIILVFCH
jgi:hypothetical protein